MRNAAIQALLTLLVLKVVQSSVVLAAALRGGGWAFVPEETTGGAVLTVALFAVSLLLVVGRRPSGWFLTATLAVLSLRTNLAVSDATTWTWLSMLGSAALLVLLVVPPVPRTFFASSLRRLRIAEGNDAAPGGLEH